MIRKRSLRRKISLFVLTAFVAAFASLNHGCSGTGTTDLDELAETFDFDLSNPKLRERLGEDDGYAFAVLYGADIHGSLETCG